MLLFAFEAASPADFDFFDGCGCSIVLDAVRLFPTTLLAVCSWVSFGSLNGVTKRLPVAPSDFLVVVVVVEGLAFANLLPPCLISLSISYHHKRGFINKSRGKLLITSFCLPDMNEFF